MMIPLDLYSTPPIPGATKIAGQHPDGRPDGLHAGAWLSPDGQQVWKPLFGKPGPDAHELLPTQELSFLKIFAGQPLFPRNWSVQQAHGYSYLVRAVATIIPDEWMSWRDLGEENLLAVEAAVRAVNAAGWQINDDISLGIDPDYNLFIVDCSNVGQVMDADETHRIEKVFELAGAGIFTVRREAAYRKLMDFREGRLGEYNGWNDRNTYQHVYMSFSRWQECGREFPPGSVYFQQKTYWKEQIPLTWIITKEKVKQEVLEKWELVWGWSPIRPKEVSCD